MTQRRIGKYELHEELGRGAMGIVYKAYDTLLNRDVALKIMIHAEQGSSEHKRRFYREAQSAGSLMHDNIVKVFDLGEDVGMPYIVMEYLPGHDLKQLMADGKLTAYREILKIWLQICNGLHHAHRRGLVHRDIKPGNIRITTNSRVKIMDFGIAKKPSSDLTQSGVVLGTVDYMAPEQVKGLGADSRSDLFSLGVMFYEMLTLKKPFPGDSVTSVIYKIVYEEPEPMEPMGVTCPPDVPDVVRKLLSKDPAKRYPSALDVARDLKASYTVWRDGTTVPGHAAMSPSLEMASVESLGERAPERTVIYDRGSGQRTPQPTHDHRAATPGVRPSPPPPTAPPPPAPAPPPQAVAAPPLPRHSNAPTAPRGAHAVDQDEATVVSEDARTVYAMPPPPPTPRPAMAFPPPLAPADAPSGRAYDPMATVAGPAPPPAPLSIDDLPMRPKEDGHPFLRGDASYPATLRSPSPAVAVPAHRAPSPRRAEPTMVDMDAPGPEAPSKRLPVFAIAMVALFVSIVLGGAIMLKVAPMEARRGGGTETPAVTAPSVTGAATPATPAAPRPALLRIETNLPASVMVDGTVVGQAPSAEPLQVPPGKHQVTLQEARFGVVVAGEYDIASGSSGSVSLAFAGEGLVQLRVKPWAEVTIDGNHAKAIEVQAVHRPIPLPAGKHTFRFEQMGRSTTREEHVVPGKTIEIDVDMTSL